jgi:hypothetical protein
MDSAKARLKEELAALYDEGAKLYGDVLGTKKEGKETWEEISLIALQKRYQTWYSRALATIRRLLPDRYEEFQEQYRQPKRKDITVTSYSISDYLNCITVTKAGMYGGQEEVFSAKSIFFTRFQQQLFILNSGMERVDSLLADIEGVLQAHLFDTELEAAEDLFKRKHVRAAGALAGVTLESHLKKVCVDHGLQVKKVACISDLNEELKKAAVVDVPTWRLIQRLADIRNLAVHAKDRDPTQDEIADLIVAVRKIIASVF